MPIHDWTRANAGIFHDFHTVWLVEIRNRLNGGLLPEGYDALAEQSASETNPDVLTLQGSGPDDDDLAGTGALAVAAAPPRVRFTVRTELQRYTVKQKHLVIRHSSGDRIIALIELVSPGNKASRHELRAFVDKVCAALTRGYRLLLADLQPPTSRDPQGIHEVIWSEISGEAYVAPADKPLTLVAYAAGTLKTAYIEPVAVGDTLPDMPLFLDAQYYIPVPLAASYQAAWHSVPRRWQRVLEGSA